MFVALRPLNGWTDRPPARSSAERVFLGPHSDTFSDAWSAPSALLARGGTARRALHWFEWLRRGGPAGGKEGYWMRLGFIQEREK